MKQTVPLFIAIVVGCVMILAYFIPRAQSWGNDITVWFNILAAFALVLGGGNLLKVQLKQIYDQTPGWAYAAVTLLSFLITLVVGLLKVGVEPNEQFPDYDWAGNHIEEGGALWWIFEYMITPFTATMFSMLAFYVASAAFRAFRAKNVEATILLITAVIVLFARSFGNVPPFTLLPESLQPVGLSDTIMDVFNTAGTRAMKIGIALGLIATSVRILLGMDRSYLGGE